MVAPAFASIDDDGFADDTQLSVAHLGQVRENSLACINERLPGVSHSFSAFQQQGAVRLPRLHSVRWVGHRPWRIWVPGLAGAFGSSPTIDVIIHCDAEAYVMRAYVHNSTMGRVPSATVLNTETDSGATGQGRNVAVAADQTLTITVPVQPGEWNVLYLLYRSEHQTAALATTTGTTTIFVATGTRLDKQLTGAAADSIPEMFIYPTTDTTVPVVYDDAYTVAYYDDDGASAGAVHFAEADPHYRDELAGAGATTSQTWQYGDLGVLELHSVAVDMSRAIAIDDDPVGYWRSLRYLQPPRSVSLSMLGHLADQIHDSRLAQLCFTTDAANLSVPSWPGILAMNGTGTGTQDPYATGSFTTVYRRTWMNRQGMRATDAAHLEAVISAAYASPMAPCEFRFKLAVRDSSGTIQASETFDQQFERSTLISMAAKWLLLTSLQRVDGLNTLTGATAGESKYSHDGATSLADVDRGFWTPITIRLDVSGLSADTLYYVDIDIQRQTVFSVAAYGALGLSGPSIRLLSGAGPR